MIVCFRCGKRPHQLLEYLDAVFQDGLEEGEEESPENYVKREEGTYNPDTETFCCTACYIMIGMPSSPNGWKAPAATHTEVCKCEGCKSAWTLLFKEARRQGII